MGIPAGTLKGWIKMKKKELALALMSVLLVTTLLLVATPLPAQDLSRDQEQDACEADARRFCSEFIPDEDRVATCIGQHKAKLSAACRKVLEPPRRR
jgi:hypothetical protein